LIARRGCLSLDDVLDSFLDAPRSIQVHLFLFRDDCFKQDLLDRDGQFFQVVEHQFLDTQIIYLPNRWIRS
jgi:hypothetical protein